MKNETRTLEMKKAVLIYTIELAFFAATFATLGILILLSIIHLGGTFRQIYVYVTLAGGGWLLADFLWALLSKKRRKKVSLLDKALTLPVAPVLLSTDVIILLNGLEATVELHRLTVGGLFCYFGVIYAIEAVYHFYVPIPGLVETEKKINAEEEKEKAEEAAKEAATEAPVQSEDDQKEEESSK